MTAATMTAPARVSPRDGLAHTATLSWRSLVQIKHNPMELLDISIQPIMFVLLFAYVFGGAIFHSPVQYINFGLAGLIVQNSLFMTMNTGVGLNTDLQKGVFDRLRSLPISRSAPLAGRIVADMVKQLWSISILFAVGAIIGFRVQTSVWGLFGAYALMLVFVLAFSWIAVLVAVVVSEPEKVQIFGFVGLFPLTFASGGFVPTATMPGWLQTIVKVNPVTNLSDAMRGLLRSGPVATPVLESLAWAVGIALVFAPLAVRAFRRRV